MLQYFHAVIKRLGAVTMLAVCLAAFVILPSAATEQPSREASWQQLMEDYRSYYEALNNQKKPRQFDAQAHRRQHRAFLGQAVKLYRQNPRDRVAYDAMLFALHHVYDMQQRLHEEICRNLRSHHLRNPKLNVALTVRFPITVVSDECMRLFHEAAASGANDKVRDTAKLVLARMYREMATFLANTSELKMTPFTYLTSGVRASFSKLPEKTAERIGRQIRNQSWLNLRWQQVRSLAFELTKQLQGSTQPMDSYYYTPQGLQKQANGDISDAAKRVRFQLERASPGAVMTDFGARDLKGETVSFDQYRGKVVALDIWATWCEPCIKELPYMRSLQRQMQGRPFQLITLSVDRNAEDVKNFIRRQPMPFVNWHIGEDQDFMSKWPVWPLPKLFVIDEKGVIRSIPRVGHQDLSGYIERLVAEAERNDSR